MNQPESIANVTALSRQPSFTLPNSVGFESVNEVTSFNNYVTILRAVNPTRRLAIPESGSLALNELVGGTRNDKDGRAVYATSIARQLKASGFISDDRPNDGLKDLALFMPVLLSLSPTSTRRNILDTALAEEMIAMAGGMKDTVMQQVAAEGLSAMTWVRFFRHADSLVTNYPIGPVLDAILGGTAYKTADTDVLMRGTKGQRIDSTSFLYAALAGTGVIDTCDLASVVSSELGAVDAVSDAPLLQFAAQLIGVDALHITPRLHSILNATEFTLLTTDREARYKGMVKLARLARYISLQPACMYAYMVHQTIEFGPVRESLSLETGDFYSTDLYRQFTERAQSIKLGDVYRHIVTDCGSGVGTTQLGDHPVLRMPNLITKLFASLPALRAMTADESSISRNPMAAPTQTTLGEQLRSKSSLARVMRAFINATGTDAEWSALNTEWGSSLGYSAPVSAPPHDYLNPKVVMSDGWTSTVPVDYNVATRCLPITSLLLQTGRPEKIALTADASVTKDSIATETSVSTVVTIQRSSSPTDMGTGKWDSVKAGNLDALGDERAVLWVVRRAADQSRYLDEVRLALAGRLPFSMYNGDLDARVLTHTTFEDFAMELGMNPYGLAAIIGGKLPTTEASLPDLAIDPQTTKLASMFFTTGSKVQDGKSIFMGGDSSIYGLPKNIRFSGPVYFYSARSVALQAASMVSLQPMIGLNPLPLTTRDFGTATSRRTASFRTVVAEPLRLDVSMAAMANVTRLDADMATAWGTTLVQIK